MTTHELAGTAHSTSTAFATAEVDRAINSDRLTMFTFVAAIGVGVAFIVGFAVRADWPVAVLVAVASFVASMAVTVLLCRVVLRNDESRNRAMTLMFWMTGR